MFAGLARRRLLHRRRWCSEMNDSVHLRLVDRSQLRREISQLTGVRIQPLQRRQYRDEVLLGEVAEKGGRAGATASNSQAAAS